MLLQETTKDGATRFVSHSADTLITDEGWSYSVDADNDGFVDIYVSNGGLSHQGVNFLYRNIAGTQLLRVLNTDPVISAHASGGASWSVYDGDGDQDLVVANGPTAEMDGFNLSLFRNDGDLKFTRAACTEWPIVSLRIQVTAPSESWMGGARRATVRDTSSRP